MHITKETGFYYSKGKLKTAERCITFLEIITDFMKLFFVTLMNTYSMIGLTMMQIDYSKITLPEIKQTLMLQISISISCIMGILVFYLLSGVGHWKRTALFGCVQTLLLLSVSQLKTDWIKITMVDKGMDVIMNLFIAIAILSAFKRIISKITEEILKSSEPQKN